MFSQSMKNKWVLVLKTLPLVALSVVLRYLVTEVFNFSLTLKFSDLAPILTGASIILGLMLTGVISDYKEAEKLPAVIARALNDLDGLSRRGLARIGEGADQSHARVVALTETVNDWLFLRASNEELWDAHSDMGEMILELDKKDVPDYYLHRLLRVNSDFSAALWRIQVIRDTDFVPAGYALMELLVGGVVISLSVVQFSSATVGFCLSAGLALIYSYLVRLTKDLDNPFEHGANNGKGSAADVDLTPFHTIRTKLNRAHDARLAQDASNTQN
jgi:hypothetical protein